MKRLLFLLTAIFAVCVSFGCDTAPENSGNGLNSAPAAESNGSESSENSQTPEEPVYSDTFRLSGITDVTDGNGVREYKVKAPYTDSYKLTSDDVKSIALYEGEALVGQGENELTVDLTEGKEYKLKIETENADSDFEIQTEALNHLITLPYDLGEKNDTTEISVNGDGSDPLVAAEIEYKKREGGTYIYSNNPEMIPQDSVGDAFIRTEDLTGEVYFTFEHANYSNVPLYLGYQIKNDSENDVYITVTNIGYQAEGSWFGQLAWYDFYNTHFELPEDYLQNGIISPKYSALDYGYIDYDPRVFQPMTYRLPAGEYFYVIGGTTADAYKGINVDNTADELVYEGKCANGNVKFEVSGGAVTATFYAYSDIAQVKANPKATGYRTGAYAAQYIGTADHCGVIDSYINWTFSDATNDGALPVSYTTSYTEYIPSTMRPYAPYGSKEHRIENAAEWMTHLNPQNNHKAIGTDIVEFQCYDEYGREVLIANDRADGSGAAANTANWMIEYQDHFTLVNQGDTDRTVKLYTKDNGTLAMLVRDGDGNVLRADYTAGLAEKGNYNYCYTVTVPAHSVQEITLDYVLVACSYGSVTHFATLES